MTADDDTSRARAERLRADLYRYEDAARRRAAPSVLSRLRGRAATALDELGGQPESATRSLRDYDHLRFGPYLGVSGEPDAAPAIRDAALASPKVVALGLREPLEVGVAHDAERLGSIGELPSGPDEYREIRLETVGRILTSTNVGSRINLRYYGAVRDLWVNPARPRRMQQTAIESLRRRLAPFLDTPDGRPRETVVPVRFRGEVAPADQRAVLRALAREIEHQDAHRLALVARVRRRGRGVEDARDAIALAAGAGLREVELQGTVRAAADEAVSEPGLLQYFNPSETGRIFETAAARGVRVTARNRVDCESVARLTWTGLFAARRMGLELGKYALHPLTLDESVEVVARVQRWFDDWTAAPAFYVDVDTVAEGRVLPRRRVHEAARIWLAMMAERGVRVVLVDTVRKSEGCHLLKTGARDSAGVFTLDAIRELDEYACRRNVRILWAGGISVPQAYELARLQIFGLYVTSAVASTRAVGPDHEADPGLAAERFPTRDGVARVKLAVEAGFVETRLRTAGEGDAAARIEAAAHIALAAPEDRAAQQALFDLVASAWTALGGGRD